MLQLSIVFVTTVLKYNDSIASWLYRKNFKKSAYVFQLNFSRKYGLFVFFCKSSFKLEGKSSYSQPFSHICKKFFVRYCLKFISFTQSLTTYSSWNITKRFWKKFQNHSNQKNSKIAGHQNPFSKVFCNNHFNHQSFSGLVCFTLLRTFKIVLK